MSLSKFLRFVWRWIKLYVVMTGLKFKESAKSFNARSWLVEHGLEATSQQSRKRMQLWSPTADPARSRGQIWGFLRILISNRKCLNP